MKDYERIESEAKVHEAKAKEMKEYAAELRQAEIKAKKIEDRIIYAAYARCPCGAGLAYDPCFEDENGVFQGPLSGYWDCSAIILGTADVNVQHTGKLPFAFYSVKSERQPSAYGETTRPEVQ